MSVVDLIKKTVTEAVADIYKIVPPDVFVEHPDNEMFGDYSTNIALVLAKQLKQSPEEIAKKKEALAKKIGAGGGKQDAPQEKKYADVAGKSLDQIMDEAKEIVEA